MAAKGHHGTHRGYQYTRWRQAVYNNCQGRCVLCGAEDHLEAHHIKSFKDCPEERNNPLNGILLCHKCHLRVHRAGGAILLDEEME